jgi:outer membrane protein OmpA-like peptidoglycan-associated protein
MAFHRSKRQRHSADDSMWTSYSDLFLGLSVIFLLLYVAASLRQGTEGFAQYQQLKQTEKENETLRQQIRAYETINKQYLDQQASDDQKKTYDLLMSKLDLLQNEANDEAKKLRLAAREHDEKKRALNEYQAMVKAIVQANNVASSRIAKRDVFIDKQEDKIEEQDTEITELNQDLVEKRNVIASGERKIQELDQQLNTNIKRLEAERKAKRISQAAFVREREMLREQARRNIEMLEAQNVRARGEIDKINTELAQTSRELASTKTNLEKTQALASDLGTKLTESERKHQERLAGLRDAFASKASAERAEFEQKLAAEKLSGEQRAAREAAFRAEAERKARGLADQIADAEGKFRRAQAEAEGAKGALAKKEGELAATKGRLEQTSRDLATAQANLEAKRKLAESIKNRFTKQGIKAEVDGKTGDVLLSFGDEYFDTGKSKLKPGMQRVLEKAMPAYSQSLFEDKRIADKISAVEIVGFASPTFKNRFIDPRKLSSADRKAVQYNLDLSYQRARAIFDHIYANMDFQHKRQLLPLVKVTGRSFLAQDPNQRTPANSNADAFCRQNDCAKLQRVIIKFNLKEE